jgi:hypothetical protein
MNHNSPTKTERGTPRGAFEFYYSMGYKRTYHRVATQYQVSLSTIKNWARAFDWKVKVEDRDSEISRSPAESPTVPSTGQPERWMRYLDVAEARILKDYLGGKTKPTTRDLVRVLRILRKLAGFPEISLEPDNSPDCSNVMFILPDNGFGPEPPKWKELPNGDIVPIDPNDTSGEVIHPRE